MTGIEGSGSTLMPEPTTVLVVEDEAIVRRVVVRRLRNFGFTVLEASSGKEALDLLSNLQNPLDLIITDVIMPEMNGRDLVNKIRLQRPGVAVLYMSGYPHDVIADRGILEEGINFIEKTAVVTDLLPKVRSLLNLSSVA